MFSFWELRLSQKSSGYFVIILVKILDIMLSTRNSCHTDLSWAYWMYTNTNKQSNSVLIMLCFNMYTNLVKMDFKYSIIRFVRFFM